jgi:hypothetical protein
MSHETVVHSAKEFVRGEVHNNTADGIGSMLVEPSRQARLRSRLSRRLRIITTIPLPDMLSRLLYPAVGREVRRTGNYGFSALPSSLPMLPRLVSDIQPTHSDCAQPDS